MKSIKFVIFSLALLVAGVAPIQAGKLYDLVDSGNVDKVRKFLEKNGNGSINEKVYKLSCYETAFHAACICKEDNVDMVKLLFQNGGFINTADMFGYTPLMFACASGNLKIVTFLLENGAKSVLNIPDKTGETPLYYACCECRLDIVKFILECGADLNVKSKKGVSPLDLIRSEWTNEQRADLLQSIFPLKKGQEKKDRGLFVLLVLAELATELGKQDVVLPLKLPLTSALYDRTDLPAKALIKVCENFVQVVLGSRYLSYVMPRLESVLPEQTDQLILSLCTTTPRLWAYDLTPDQRYFLFNCFKFAKVAHTAYFYAVNKKKEPEEKKQALKPYRRLYDINFWFDKDLFR